jgi:hypothetical protein
MQKGKGTVGHLRHVWLLGRISNPLGGFQRAHEIPIPPYLPNRELFSSVIWTTWERVGVPGTKLSGIREKIKRIIIFG